MLCQVEIGILMIISMGLSNTCGDLESRDLSVRARAKKSVIAAGCCAFLVGVCVLFTITVAADV